MLQTDKNKNEALTYPQREATAGTQHSDREQAQRTLRPQRYCVAKAKPLDTGGKLYVLLNDTLKIKSAVINSEIKEKRCRAIQHDD